ncbi:prolipoprotein diacylglyceryl transferase [Coxiella endosymbiont of Amblyomma americanum]|uniref:prolipoprotein diacylglyceryl transferase n=1 Tax=Coxiella endosymbiont of Amblyomma americanum TaxID=325775 RepID=UPI00057F8FD3|nr:prolipoprotein diacylglyceryl transferase [Coxiella endosymbiont of Amblyomma americanum]AJC50239.1 prolipoprotein diacylglyceryl transferase [Coxiella endosymbiont of Amblyomma americanum]AUJ58598.1 prolipoprotein diacylglyceryl transferase [Coxiella-like endosymbiont of Amblyomma americanum]
MLYYPKINPIAYQIGPFKMHWYGFMYVVGLVFAWYLALYRACRSRKKWNVVQISDLIFYSALGIIIGGRLGYIIFYDFFNFIAHPLIIYKVWNGGMSFHGGLIGEAIAMWIFSRYTERQWTNVTDFVAPLVPLGLGAGRIGNFINNELWGRVTTVWCGMVFPGAGSLPRHPSQLYEFFLEGILLFVIVWFFSNRPRPCFSVTSLFLLFYGLFRFIVEFFRQPDLQLGYIAFGWLTMGQLLSLPMIIGGGLSLLWAYEKHK